MDEHFKRYANLQALAALQGVELRAVRNDLERWTFIATAGALTAELDSLDAVASWLDTQFLAEGSRA